MPGRDTGRLRGEPVSRRSNSQCPGLIQVDNTRQPAAVIPDVVNVQSDGGC